MQLRRTSGQHVLLELTEDELATLRRGLDEALEALEDWEFSTRMGVDRAEARRVRDELRDATRRMEASEPDT